jgi:anti-sigma B factor antagonist
MSDFEISRLADGSGLKLVGELDLATAARLTSAAVDLSTAGTLRRLDVSELTFVDSCGLQAILMLARSLNGDGPLVILNPSRSVARVFELMGLEAHAGLEIRRQDAAV